MNLVEQNQSFKFAGGVETKMDSKAVPPVRLLALENGVFSKAISIKKRNGYDLLSRAVDGTTRLISRARCLAKRENELLLFTNNNCYSKEADGEKWVDAGAIISAPGYDRPAVHTGTAQTMPDHATNNGVTVYAWEDSRGGVWWTAVDAESGRIYKAPTQANASGERPRCLPNGDVLHIYYAVPTQHRIDCIIVNPSAPTADVASVIVITDLDATNPVYDAAPAIRASGTVVVIAWHEHATTNVRVGFVTTGAELGSPSRFLPSVYRAAVALSAASPLAVSYQPGYAEAPDSVDSPVLIIVPDPQIAIAYQTGASFVASFYDVSTSSPFPISHAGDETLDTATTLTRIALEYEHNTGSYVWAAGEETAAQSSQRYCRVNYAAVGDVGTATKIRSVGLASRAFQAGDNTDVFAVFVHDTTYFNTYVTLRLSDFAPAGRHLPSSAAAPTRTHLASAHSVDDVVTIALPYKTRLQSSRNDKFTETGIRRVVMDFDSNDSHQYAQIGAGLYLGGACPQHYDGRLWTEQSFHFGPERITTAAGSGGSLTVSSTYEYVSWYEWTDGQGEIHRGPTSVGLTVVTGGSDTKITLTLPTLRVTRKSNVRICVARSLPGDASRFWRVASLDPTTAGASNGYVANDTTVDTAVFVDAMSDDDLQLQEQLYTTAGILSNDPAALGSHIVASKNRIFWTDANNGNIVRYSQTIATGYGLEVAPELKLDIPPTGGDVTALTVMDDVVYVFKQNAVYAFAGDGPFATGSSTNSGPTVSGFSAPQKIPGAAVGCTDPKSIAVTSQGIMFRSGDQGIWRVGIDRQLQYTGSPVELYNTQTIRRAIEMPKRTAVLFLTDSGKSLYYDYLFDQWSTFTNHEGNDAAVVDEEFYYLRTNNVVFKETPGMYADGGARITLRFETAWLHMHEHLQGFQRFWKLLLLGTWSSPHQIGVQYRKDYDEAWSDPLYLDATGDTDPTGWITDYVHATATLAKAADATQYILVRSRTPGTAGNTILVQVVASPTSPAVWLDIDAPNNVRIKYKAADNPTWAELAAVLDSSLYVQAAVNTATGALEEGFQVFTTGGVNDDVFGTDPILGTDYGEGNFGDGVYGGTGPQIYQWRYGIHEDGEAIQFRFEDFEKAGLEGASFELTEMTIIGGVIKPDIRPFAASRSV